MVEDKLGQEIALAHMRLTSRANQCWQYSGLDSPGVCRYPENFKKYPHAITYQHNSRGFRDQEWPRSLQELRSAVWCIGDSFTVGLGQPFQHIWPQVLQRDIDQRTINVSLDGASNQWIARQARTIMQEVAPKNVIIMWSYLSRREIDDDSLTDEERRLPYIKSTEYQDAEVFYHCRQSIKSREVNVIESIIPSPYNLDEAAYDVDQIWSNIRGPDWPEHPPKNKQELENLPDFIKDELREVHRCFTALHTWLPDFPGTDQPTSTITGLFDGVLQVEQLDYARDGHHFDIKTAEALVRAVVPMLAR